MLSLNQLSAKLGLGVAVAAERLSVEVQWVNVTELADPSAYLGDRELVLTNGIWLADCPAADYVQRLAAHQVAGLGFGLRNGIEQPPTELVAACTEHRLPLLTVPPAMPFTSISRAVAAALRDEAHGPLQEAIRRSEQLTAALSSGDGLRRITHLIHTAQDVPCALVDRFGRVLAEAGVQLGCVEASTAAQLIGNCDRVHELTLADHPATMIRVEGFGRPEVAFVYLSPVEQVSRVDFSHLEQALRFVSIELARMHAVRETELKFAAELFDLVMTQPLRDAELIARLTSLGLTVEHPLLVVAAHTTDPSVPQHELAAELADYLSDLALPAATFGHDGLAVAIVAPGADGPAVPDLAHRIYRQLSRGMTSDALAVSAGSRAAPHHGLRTSLIQAIEGIRLARERSRQPRVVTFEDATSYRVLLTLLDDKCKRQFAEHTLSPVLDHDRERSTQLVETLRRYFENEESLTKTADALHVHVNTLRGRLQRIEELTERCLRNPADRTDLLLALEILEYV